ncbi:putative RNA-directed DNA polymerase from transposon X-element [Trichonephila clavipes]|nr:putative RNA-directed DNA polymerase from transposon X-element [Trichonephila clavipes]
MGDDVMEIHASQSDEVSGRSVAQTFVFWLLAGSTCRLDDLTFISWNCRGLRTRLADLKSLLSTHKPACVALQETFLKSPMTLQVRGYNCVRRDVDGDTSPNGGVCLFTSHLYPSNVVTLHTSLQAVAVPKKLSHPFFSHSLLCLFTTQRCCATSGFESFSQSIASSIYFAR